MCFKRFLCLVLTIMQIAGMLAQLANAQVSRRPRPAPQVMNMQQGLQIKLSEGSPVVESQAANPRAEATRLAADETESLLRRLPQIKAEAGDEQDFALREKSLPPPRTGKTVEGQFPPAPSRDTTAQPTSGPLEVLRYAPEGEVPLAAQLSVTFSQPMVAVTSHADTVAEGVPVRLTPQPQGRWRWVGAKTLLFETDGHLPMATDYQVEVAKGTKTATGASLAETRAWRFSTPPPQVKQFYPQVGPTVRDPLMFVEFDQRIDPAAVLKTIHLRSGRRDINLRLAGVDELAADEMVSNLAKAAEKGRWLAFRAVAVNGDDLPLPADAGINVSVGPGTPSAEGPRTTAAAQPFTFRTYGPLRVTDHRCGWQEHCTPFDQWQIQFSNPLDAAAFEQSQIRVSPEIPGMKTAVYGNLLSITGIKRGRTTYHVTVNAAVRDQFGQTLGTDVPLAFNVGSAEPALAGPDKTFLVLDPSAQPRLSIYTINQPSLKVRLYRVGPENWAQFQQYLRATNDNTNATPPGRLIVNENVPVKAEADEMAETRIDLSRALENHFGHVVAIIESTLPPRNRYDRQRIAVWAAATQIGLTAFVDKQELVGWATSLKDGKPVEGARMTIAVAQTSGLRGESPTTTDAGGLARLPLTSDGGGPKLLIARKDKDVAFLPENAYWWSETSGWVRRPEADALSWFVFDDRKMYRPGEEVHVKGWLRRIGTGTDGDVNGLDGYVKSVTYSLKDSRGNEVMKGAAQVNALGGFDAVLKLPATMNLGYANLQLEARAVSVALSNLNYNHQVQVQEFRRPEFEVTAQANEGPHFVGGSANVTATAAYYAGGGLANSEVTWQVTTRATQFTPPNRDDFTFGKWIPWWINYYNNDAPRVETFTGRTDGAGKHSLRVDFLSVDPPRPSTVTAEASVMDVNRQQWTAATSMLVHPADLYVGVRSPRTFVQKGEPLVVQSIVCDLDGKLIAGRAVKVRAVLLDWVFEKGEWKQKEANPQECEVKSTTAPVECRFETKEGGTYRITATVMDDRERRNESELTLWVAGGKVVPKRNVEQEDAGLIPDRKEYQPGDTAEILVQAPFTPAEGVMTLRRSGIVTTERFKMDTASTTLKVPIKEGYTPNVTVQVDLVGASARTDEEGKASDKLPKRPAFAKGSLNLSVPPLTRKLAVEAAPRNKALEPGGETVVDVTVKDAAGRAVSGSELAIVVVDEAILGLTGYRIGDPLSTFYAQRGTDTSDYELRREVLLGNPDDLIAQVKNLPINGRALDQMQAIGGLAQSKNAMPAAAPMAMRAAKAEGFAHTFQAKEQEPIRTRENFDALATFAAAVPTDSDGRASVKVKLPDNLTRYRIMVVAVAGGRQFGGGESTITARLPLMARPSAPRFLNFGDKFELPVVIQNQTDAPMEVNVGVRATNAALTDGAGRRVTVPANDRVEVRFPSTTERAGTARFQIAAASGKWADAAEVSLPVWTPATTEAFATYGEIDAGAIVQPVKAPTDAVTQFGGIEITTSSTELQALTDAVLYLTRYPFECAEQMSSRVMAIAALKDVLAAFKAQGLPSPQAMVDSVSRDVKRLRVLQNDDGGFGFWRRGEESWPYISIHVAHALQRAKEKGFDVPDEMRKRSLDYLRNVEQHIPHYYGIEARRALIAYALYVRNRMGDRDTARARRLMAEAGLDGLSLEAVGWLLSVLTGDSASTAEVTAIRRHLNNRATEEAATAHFVTSYKDSDYLLLNSDRRADAVILESLISDQPANDLIPKLVRGLLGHRVAGRWENTQENSFVLLALDKYFAAYEKTTPNFTARAWLGDRYAGEHDFKGRTTERFNVTVPMRYLAETVASQNVVLAKDGAGRLYYRIGMQYAPASLKLEPSEHGFTVERIYEAIDKADDVRRDNDGNWHIKAGARVRVRLTMVAPSRRYHVALVDPIPAGLEAMNPELAVTGSIPQDPKESTNRSWWWRVWYEHQNMRDERVEAFASLLWDGVYTYSYVARATTPGTFVVPPTKAEEMYHPETFGRSATDRVIVE
ncbi:MAG: alpha-2-macroglobulin family protein [Blastocatellia bacterium]